MAGLFMDPKLNGGTYYLSEALEIINTNPNGDQQAVNRAKLDTPGQFVRVKVNNDSAAPITGVRAQIWAIAFSAGMASSQWLLSLGGTTGRTITSNPANGDTVLVNKRLPIQDPNQWLPTKDELVAAGLIAANSTDEVHACLYGNVYAAGDAASKEITATPPTNDQAFNPANNVHHAQRNIALFFQSSVNAKSMDILMHVGNPDAEAEHVFELEIQEIHLGRRPELEQAELVHLLQNPQFQVSREQLAPDAVPGVAIREGDELVALRLAQKPLDDLQIDAGECAEPAQELTLGPDETRQIRLQATLPDEHNVLRVFDIQQALDGRSAGAARVLLVSAAEARVGEPAYAG